MTPEEKAELEKARNEGRAGDVAEQQRKEDMATAEDLGQTGKGAKGQRQEDIRSTKAERRAGQPATEKRKEDIQRTKDEGTTGKGAELQRGLEYRQTLDTTAGPGAAEKRKQEKEAAINRGELPGGVMEQQKRERKATAVEMGHIPGPAMEAQKTEEKGIEMAHADKIREEDVANIKQARTEGRIVTGHGPAAGRAAEQAEQRSEEIQSEAKKEREADIGKYKEELKSYPEARMWAKGTEEIHTQREKDKLKEEIKQDRLEGKIITGPGLAAGRAAQQRMQAVEDQGKSPGPKLEALKSEDEQRSKTEATTGESAEARRQQETERAREEGRIGPEATAQRVAEMRRAEIEGRTQPPSPSIAPAPLPPDVLSRPSPAVQLPIVPASTWNASANTVQYGYTSASFEESIGKGTNSPHGRIANRAQPRGLQHPWLIQPFWDSELQLTKKDMDATGRSVGAWCCHVLPGFINGHPPAIYVRRGYLPQNDQLKVWGNDYGKKNIDDNEAAVGVLLTDEFRPFIKFINFADSRAKVIDAEGVIHNGEVPLFFRVQGAFKPEKLDESDITNNVLIAASLSDTLAFQILNNQPLVVNLGNINKDDGLPEGTRYLYRADIVLQVDRPALKQNFEFDDIGLLRLTGFDVTLPTRNKYSARLYTVPIYHAPKEPTLDEVQSGAFNDRNFDELVIGILWLLSPDTTNLTPAFDVNGNVLPPPIDGSWMGWVEHQVFWNLNYCSIIQIDPVKIDTSLDYFKQILGVLAGGAGYLIALSYVNPLEAEYNKIQTALNQSIVRGAFWTG